MVFQRRRVNNNNNNFNHNNSSHATAVRSSSTRHASKRNESLGLLRSESDGSEKYRLSDDDASYEMNNAWEALWLSRKALTCAVNTSTSYRDLKDEEEKLSKKKRSSASTGFQLKPRSSSKAPTQKYTPPPSIPKVDSSDSSDSSHGESYRKHVQHVEETKAPAIRSCLLTPKFLTRSPSNESTHSNKTDKTSPPSPLTPPKEKALQEEKKEDDDDEPLYSVTVDEQVLLESPRSIVSDIRYSLRTSIGDGSLPQASPMDHQRQIRSLRPNGVRLNVSHWSDTGMRPYMEDRYVVESLGAVQVELSSTDPNASVHGFSQVKRTRVKMPMTFVGVYDGHGGDKASQYCADWMSSYIKNQQTYPHDLGYAMRDAYKGIDQDFCLSGHVDGTTACSVSIIGGKRVVCANAGDSRAIIVRKDGSVVRVSRDHKPGMSSEAKRIEDLGGRIVFWQKRWRVEGLLAVSRGIGDASLKPYVTAEPEVCEYDVQPEDLFLVISSDGVWDAVNNEEAAQIVLETACTTTPEDENKLFVDTNRFKWVAKSLCQHARSCGSADNFAVVCVDLQSCGNPEATSGCYEIR